jgi:hypothetical protein
LSSPASVRSLCLHNAEVASRAGARAIARAWNSLAAISQACETGAIPATHALARGLVKEIRRKMISPPLFFSSLQVHQILDHFEHACDLQTVAVMSRVLLSTAKRPHAPPPPPVVAAVADKAVKSMRAKGTVAVVGVGSVSNASASSNTTSAATTNQAEHSDRVWTKRLFQKNKNRASRSESEAEPVQPASVAPANVTGYLISSPPASVQGKRKKKRKRFLFFFFFVLLLKKKVAVQVGAVIIPSVIANYSGSMPYAASSASRSSAVPPILMLEPERCLIDPARIGHYLMLQSIYADHCLSFGLFKERASMVKCPLRVPSVGSNGRGLSFEPVCPSCSRNVAPSSRMCQTCRVPMFPCALCRLPILGLITVCAMCGHGCHTSCIQKWVGSSHECPMQGCNCKCSK